jgi:hypothetical protein
LGSSHILQFCGNFSFAPAVDVCRGAKLQGHAKSHAATNAARRVPIRSMCEYHALVIRPACNPLRWNLVVSPSPSSPAASKPQNLTSGRHLSRLAPKFLILEVIGLEKAEPIFITASRSQDIMRSAHRDPARVFPSRMAGFSFDVARWIRPFSTQPPPALLPESRSARERSAVCGPARQS